MNLATLLAPKTLLLPVALAALAAGLCAQGPGGLPPVPVPPENPITAEKAVLGKILFWEEQMSSDNRVACGTCHRPESGGGDPRPPAIHPGRDNLLGTPDDIRGSAGLRAADASNNYRRSPQFGFQPQATGRSSQGFYVAPWAPELFWDGRARGRFLDPQTGVQRIAAGGALENQASEPPISSVEMAHDVRSWTQITGKLAGAKPLGLATNLPADVSAAIAANPTYPQLFAAAFGDSGITATRIAFALATYQRTLVPDQTPWDQFQRGNTAALTMHQQGGMNLFNGPARCNLCHTPGLFTDNTYRNIGVTPVPDDMGRQGVTNNVADRGKFKVPSLRNVGLRRMLMHNGLFQTVQQAMGFYNNGGGPFLDNKDPALIPLNLMPMQLDALADFVGNALTDPRVAARQFPFDRPTLRGELMGPNGFVFGAGSAGTGGLVPQILAEVPANVGNGEFKLGVHQARGGAQATLAISLLPAIPGTNWNGIPLHADIFGSALFVNTVLGGTNGTGGQGFGTVRQAIPADPSLSGINLTAQWLVWDTGTPFALAVTPGASVRIF